MPILELIIKYCTMNKIFTTPRGFPFDEVTMERLQAQYDEPTEALSAIFGGDRILKGVISSGGNYTDGFIVFRGEILPFVGGPIDNIFSIIEEVIDLPYNVGTRAAPIIEDHPGYTIRYAQIGTIGGAETTLTFSRLKRARLLEYSRRGQVFLGTIVPTVRQGILIQVTFPDIATSSYQVVSSFRSLTSVFISDFYFQIQNQTSTSFQIFIKTDIELPQLTYQYTLLPNFLSFAL